MYALDNSSGASVMPPVKNQQFQPNAPRWFTEGGNGVAPSYPGADWFNIVQAELLGVLTEASVTPNKGQLNQLAAAIKQIISANTGELTALRDLFIGVPIPYPLSTVPTGCLAMNGQRFDTRRYPKLAQKYPSGQLPDLRGEFIRGWDNGRGVDTGRGLLSWQKGSYSLQEAGKPVDNIVSFAWNSLELLGLDKAENHDGFNLRARSNAATSTWNPSANILSNGVYYIGYTRPRNIAFHYICLAA